MKFDDLEEKVETKLDTLDEKVQEAGSTQENLIVVLKNTVKTGFSRNETALATIISNLGQGWLEEV